MARALAMAHHPLGLVKAMVQAWAHHALVYYRLLCVTWSPWYHPWELVQTIYLLLLPHHRFQAQALALNHLFLFPCHSYRLWV